MKKIRKLKVKLFPKNEPFWDMFELIPVLPNQKPPKGGVRVQMYLTQKGPQTNNLRDLLIIAQVNMCPNQAWKTRYMMDGKAVDETLNHFIVGFRHNNSLFTYILEDCLWDMFECEEVDKAIFEGEIGASVSRWCDV